MRKYQTQSNELFSFFMEWRTTFEIYKCMFVFLIEYFYGIDLPYLSRMYSENLMFQVSYILANDVTQVASPQWW